jgi:peptidase M1-like protein
MGNLRQLAAASPRAIALLSVLAGPPLVAATPASPPVVAYRIEVALDPEKKMLDGRERLVWRNRSSDTVSELRFHLYLNGFKNDLSTLMRESGGRLRSGLAGRKADDWGWIDVLSMTTDRGEDLRAKASFVQPDGNDPQDETVLSVPLPRPVPPRGEIALDIAFRAKLPRIFARTGFVRDYFLVGQWFPKLGVYEPAGMRGRRTGGWNCHAFHANSEFYADFGSYDVSITLPSNFIVGATGKRVAESKAGEKTTHRYVQDNVHDFAWTADPRFQVTEFTFDPARDTPGPWIARAARELGMPEADLALKPISCRLLLQPGHERGRERYLRSTKEAIAFFGLWYGVYPYETLTIVDPPDDGTESGGMEYPTFYTGEGAEPFLTRWPLDKVRLIELVTFHEYGHQYWYGIVGSNEFEEAWLDEGLTDDAERRAMSLAYGPRDTAKFPGGIGFDSLSLAHVQYTLVPNLDPIHRCAWCYASRATYGVNSYAKVGLLMTQLRNDLGAEAFSRSLRAFFQEWKFRHPSTQDFFAVFERVSGRDLSSHRRNLLEGMARLDWQVVSAASRRIDRPDGVFDRVGGRVTLEEGRVVSPTTSGAKEPKEDSRKSYASTVLFGNLGEWQHGAKARMVFEDGTAVERSLPGAARWVRYRVRYGSPLAHAVVDPERRNVWDWNHLNDSKVLGSGEGPARTLGERAGVKYFGWVSYLVALWTQIAWALA